MGHEFSRESTSLRSGSACSTNGDGPKRARGARFTQHRNLALLALPLLVACGSPESGSEIDSEDETPVDTTEDPLFWFPSNEGAVGLALEIADGVGEPLTVRAGQRFYLNQLDIRTIQTGIDVDEDLDALDRTGDFKHLDWRGLDLRDTSFSLSQNPDGTFTRRRFYRDARWMQTPSQFIIVQVDNRDMPTALPHLVNIGSDDQRRPSDDFFIRRLRGIQYTTDCPTETSCDGASAFEEEALLEVRNSRHPERTFKIASRTTALKVFWTLQGGRSYTIPVTQDQNPTFDYGFKMDVEPTTPARPNGTYAPGTDIEFKVTLRDGSGNRLHPDGSLPTFNDVAFGTATADTGITYWMGFFERVATYYRRKHKERMFVSAISGPAQDIQPIRTFLGLEDFVGESDVQTTGTFENDGVFAQARVIPAANKVFTGQLDAPVPDRWTYHLPDNARPGTYYVTTKARRVYLGEDVAVTSQVKIQVGTPTPTYTTLNTGPCTSCHSNGGELSKVLHGNSDRATCIGCHGPLSFEPEGPVYVRAHYIHSRSDRFDEPLKKCKTCHLNRPSIQRTSKSACLSCHTSYPQSHVNQFGPITDNYVGGGTESFQQCTGSCHTNHPGSGL